MSTLKNNKNCISKSEEFELFNEFNNNKSQKNRDKIMSKYSNLVNAIAYQYQRFYGIDKDDLISEGSIGLMKAIEMFDIKKGFRFSTYASFWIKAYIKQYVFSFRSIVKRTRRNIELMKKYNKAYINGLNNINSMFFGDVSLDKKVGDEDSTSEAIDFLKDESVDFEEKTIEENLKKKQIDSFKKSLEKLKEKERYVIERRHCGNEQETLETIAKEMNMTSEGVRMIEKRAIEKLKLYSEKSNL